MKPTTLCVLLLSLSSAARAQTVMIQGAGTQTCAAFTQHYQKDPAMEAASFIWAAGYMSGFNNMANLDRKPTKDLAGASISDQQSMLRGYCADHPLENYLTAVITLWSSLPEIPYPDNN